MIHPITKRLVYTVRFGIAKGLKKKGGLGFLPQIFKLSLEEKFLMNLDYTGKVVYDVGAAFGVYSIFFAKKVGSKGKVVAFEPNPKIVKGILENVKINEFSNVKVLPIALGETRKTDLFAFPSNLLGIGSLEEHEKARILALNNAVSVNVPIETVDYLVNSGRIAKPDFVKIDVQGFELAVLKGMSDTIDKHKPKLFVEIHALPNINWQIENTLKILNFLSAKGYSMFHVESGKYLDIDDFTMIHEDEHLLCEAA